MARLLYTTDSTAFLLKVLRRFIRLARKHKGAEFLAQLLAPLQQLLIEKQTATRLADEAREDAYDDIQLADKDLDDAIRTAFETCAQFDRNNPGQNITNNIFPTGTFSEIIRMPYSEEPAEADRIAARIEKLGATHHIYPLAAQLHEKLTMVNTAIETYKQTVTLHTRAQVDEEAAKAEVRRQYEFAYLDARKQLGTKFAERVFPAVATKSKGSEDAQTAVK